jgi:hypothetical protein
MTTAAHAMGAGQMIHHAPTIAHMYIKHALFCVHAFFNFCSKKVQVAGSLDTAGTHDTFSLITSYTQRLVVKRSAEATPELELEQQHHQQRFDICPWQRVGVCKGGAGRRPMCCCHSARHLGFDADASLAARSLSCRKGRGETACCL